MTLVECRHGSCKDGCRWFVTKTFADYSKHHDGGTPLHLAKKLKPLYICDTQQTNSMLTVKSQSVFKDIDRVKLQHLFNYMYSRTSKHTNLLFHQKEKNIKKVWQPQLNNNAVFINVTK